MLHALQRKYHLNAFKREKQDFLSDLLNFFLMPVKKSAPGVAGRKEVGVPPSVLRRLR